VDPVSDMSEETQVYDSADFLDSEEAVLAYLEEALASGDAAFIAYALNVLARGGGLSAAPVGNDGL
jgi:DNA-binding phage protein